MSDLPGAHRELPVGDPTRPELGRAVLHSLRAAALFLVFTCSAKAVRGLYVHEPWQDDPYDAAVSLAIVFVPLLSALCLLRTALCRRAAPLPMGRALGLRRASRLLVVVMLTTLLSDWTSVLLQARRSAWTTTTALMIGALALITASAVAVALELRRVRRGSPPDAETPEVPDWLADAVSLLERAASRLGPLRPVALPTLRWVDSRLLGTIRCHPLGAAGVLALAFGVSLTLPAAIEEGYSPSGLLLVLAVGTCAMFAFLVIVGTHLRLIGPLVRPPRRGVVALVAACASVPLALAFRDPLWWALGKSGRSITWTQLSVLLTLVAITTGVVSFAASGLRRDQ